MSISGIGSLIGELKNRVKMHFPGGVMVFFNKRTVGKQITYLK